jgi:hypothetical protein
VQRALELVRPGAVVEQHELVTGALVLRDLLRRQLEPLAGGVRVELRRRQLNDAPAGVAELVEPRLEQRFGDDGDPPGTRVFAQIAVSPSSSATSRACSSSGS